MNNPNYKTSNILKGMLLIIAGIIAYFIYSISSKLENGRYQMGDNSEGYIRIFDTRTGELYYIDDNGDYIKYKNGKEIKIKMLPK